MKIALTVDNTHISTVFDFADTVMIADIENCKVRSKTEFEFAPQAAALRAQQLQDLRVEILITGAISSDARVMLQHSGIQVLSGTTGDIDDILSAYIHNELSEPRFRLPGFGSNRHAAHHPNTKRQEYDNASDQADHSGNRTGSPRTHE